jgi:phage shock protein PspC (stress-responsive transcriptional regulator)
MTTSTDTQQTTELRRPTEGRMIAGVAAGLGNRFSINPWWFRIGFLVLAVFGGLGLALYGIGWLLIPQEGADQPIVVAWIAGIDTSNTPMMIGIALIGAAALILAASLDLVSGNLLFAAVLFVIGVLLYRGDIGGSDEPKSPDAPDDGGDDVPADVLLDSVDATDLDEPAPDGGGPPDGSGDPPQETHPTPPPAPPHAEPKQRSILGQLAIAAALIAVGGLALLDAAGVLFPGFVHYVALALGVVGAGLLVGTIFGRARWLIFIGLLLVPVLLVASVVPSWTFNGEAGDAFYRPLSIEEIEQVGEQYELAAGSLHIDLTSLDVEPGAVRIPLKVKIGAGEIRILVPAGVPALVDASVGIGALDLFGDDRAGLGVSSIADSGSPPVFLITAEAGVGRIVVREER